MVKITQYTLVLIYKLHTLPIVVFYILHQPFLLEKMKPNINRRRQNIFSQCV